MASRIARIGGVFAIGCLVACWPAEKCAIAQQASEKLEEQKLAMSGFYVRFVQPLDACTVADAAMLTKAQALVGAVREKYRNTFEVVEKHPIYLATVYAARVTDDRYKAPDGKGKRAALQDCLRGIELLENPNAQRQYDGYMQYLLELLLTPT